MEGGEGGFPEAVEFDGSVGGDLGFQQFKEPDLVGIERGELLDEGLEVVVDLCGVETDDPADGRGSFS